MTLFAEQMHKGCAFCKVEAVSVQDSRALFLYFRVSRRVLEFSPMKIASRSAKDPDGLRMYTDNCSG